MSGMTLSDGYNIIDISKSTNHKNRTPRVAGISAPGLPSDTLQFFNSEGFVLHIEGDWVLAPGQGGAVDPDYRAIVETWRRNNILVNYIDDQQNSWYNIKSFVSHLTSGQPAAAGNYSTVIHYALDLTEALRTKERGDLEENPIAGGILIAPSFVSGTSVAEAAVQTRVFPSMTVQQNDIIVLFPAGADGANNPSPTVSDTLGNTWTRQSYMYAANGLGAGMYTATMKASGNTVITVDWGQAMFSVFGVAGIFRNSTGTGASAGGFVGNSQSTSKIVSTGISGLNAGSLLVGSLNAGYTNGPWKFTPQGTQTSVLFDNDSGFQDALDIETVGEQGTSTLSYQTSAGTTPNATNATYIMNVIELKS